MSELCLPAVPVARAGAGSGTRPSRRAAREQAEPTRRWESAIPPPASPGSQRPRGTEKASLKRSLPDCFWRYLIDLLLLQITQVSPTDFPQQGPGQGAPQGQVSADQLLDLGNSSRGYTQAGKGDAPGRNARAAAPSRFGRRAPIPRRGFTWEAPHFPSEGSSRAESVSPDVTGHRLISTVYWRDNGPNIFSCSSGIPNG